jgi:hypothetical protein
MHMPPININIEHRTSVIGHRSSVIASLFRVCPA